MEGSRKVAFVFAAIAVLLCVATTLDARPSTRPTVLWHGMGDTCCYPFSMGAIKDAIQKQIPGIYVYSVEVGSSIEEDELSGFFGDVNAQVDQVCAKIKKDANLQGGFNAVGFSQGGQFLRAYVERCNDPPVHNLITLGGQHFGIVDFPNCVSVNSTICYAIEELLDLGAYNYIVQEALVQAQYFRDPMDIATYLKASKFLADINNEGSTKNATYKENLVSLNNFVMGKFTEDTVVVPRESEWFGKYQDGNVNVIQTMRQTDLYQQDWIGLKTLDQQGKVKFLSMDGNHMQFSLEWFTQNVTIPYLSI